MRRECKHGEVECLRCILEQEVTDLRNECVALQNKNKQLEGVIVDGWFGWKESYDKVKAECVELAARVEELTATCKALFFEVATATTRFNSSVRDKIEKSLLGPARTVIGAKDPSPHLALVRAAMELVDEARRVIAEHEAGNLAPDEVTDVYLKLDAAYLDAKTKAGL